MSSTKMFMSIPELKVALGVSSIDIRRSTTTDKLYGVSDKGVLKVEQAIDFSLPIKFIYDSPEELLDGCIINVVPKAPALHTL